MFLPHHPYKCVKITFKGGLWLPLNVILTYNNINLKPNMSENYDILSENNQSTVVSHYERLDMVRETFYQSETDLEREMIE